MGIISPHFKITHALTFVEYIFGNYAMHGQNCDMLAYHYLYTCHYITSHQYDTQVIDCSLKHYTPNIVHSQMHNTSIYHLNPDS